MGGGRAPVDNSAAVAREQRRIAEKQLEFDREEARRNAERQAALDEWTRTRDDRRYALDLKADSRSDLALTFEKSMGEAQLAYQKERDARLYGLQEKEFELASADKAFYRTKATREEERILEKEKAAADKEKARLESGTSRYDFFRGNIEAQLKAGSLSPKEAESYLREYITSYELAGKEADISDITKKYAEEIAPARFSTGLGAAYSEILGRDVTEEEKAAGLERFKSGYYGSVSDLKESLYKSEEYRKKFDKSYLDSYYDTMFGAEIKDEKGEKTGKRSFKFDSSLLPKYEGDIKTTGVTLPEFGKEFTGTAAEIEQQLQNIRDSRQFLYSAGLTNLQGEIDKETQKLKNEGAKEVQKIAAQGDIYKSVIGAFSF